MRRRAFHTAAVYTLPSGRHARFVTQRRVSGDFGGVELDFRYVDTSDIVSLTAAGARTVKPFVFITEVAADQAGALLSGSAAG